MKKTIEVGQQIGYIKAPKSTFIEDTELNQYKPEELTLLCTGSQGAERVPAQSKAEGS